MLCDVGKRYGGMKRVEKWKKERIWEVGDDKMKEMKIFLKKFLLKFFYLFGKMYLCAQNITILDAIL